MGTAFEDVAEARGGKISDGHAIVDWLTEVVVSLEMAHRFKSVTSRGMD